MGTWRVLDVRGEAEGERHEVVRAALESGATVATKVWTPNDAEAEQQVERALGLFGLSDERVSCAIPATSSPERMRKNARAGDAPWFGEEEREYVASLARNA